MSFLEIESGSDFIFQILFMSFLEIERGEWVRFGFSYLIFQILFISFLKSGSDLMPDEKSLKSNKFQLPISSFRNGLCISSQNMDITDSAFSI